MGAFSSKEEKPVSVTDNALTTSDKHYPQKTAQQMDDRLSGFKFKPLLDGEKPSFHFKSLSSITDNPTSKTTTPIANTSTNADLQGFRFKTLESAAKPLQQQQQANNLTQANSSAVDINLAGFRFKTIEPAKQTKQNVEKLTKISTIIQPKEKLNLDHVITKQLQSLNLNSETQTPKRVIATAKRTIPKTTVQTREPEKKNHLQTYADLDIYTSDESSEAEDDAYSYMTDDDSFENLTSNSSTESDSLFNLNLHDKAKAISKQDYTPASIKSKKAAKKLNTSTKSTGKTAARVTPKKTTATPDSSVQKRYKKSEKFYKDKYVK